MPNGDIDQSFAEFPVWDEPPAPLGVLGEGATYSEDLSLLKSGQFLVGGKYVNSFNTKNRDVAYIARHNADGSVDRSFGRRGGTREIWPRKWPYRNAFRQIKLLRSGKILVGGNLRNRFFVGRLTKQGNWDRSFGRKRSGKVVSEIKNSKGRKCRCSVVSGMTTDRRGRILLSGWSYPDGTQHTMNLMRFTRSGRLDRRFGRGGKVRLKLNQYVTVRRIVVHPSGKIFVAAWLGYQRAQKFAVFAFKPNGKPLRSFFRKGRYIRPIGETSTAEDMLIDCKGRLVVSGGTFKNGDASFVIKRFRVGR